DLFRLPELSDRRRQWRKFQAGRLDARAVINRRRKAHLLAARYQLPAHCDVWMQVPQRSQRCKQYAAHAPRLAALETIQCRDHATCGFLRAAPKVMHYAAPAMAASSRTSLAARTAVTPSTSRSGFSSTTSAPASHAV